MLSEQDKSEIRKSYRNAIDPRQQVKILTQLYLVSRGGNSGHTGAAFQVCPPKTEPEGPAETHLCAGVQGRGNGAPALRRIFPAGG